MLYQKQVNRLKCSGPAPQYRPLSCSHLVRWSTKISFNIQLINLSQEISHFISAEAKVLIRERIYLTGWLTASVTQSGGDGWEQPIISSKPHSHIVISNHWAQIQNSNKPRGSIVVAGFSSFSSVLNSDSYFRNPLHLSGQVSGQPIREILQCGGDPVLRRLLNSTQSPLSRFAKQTKKAHKNC